jgi:putative chitinase
MVALDELKRIMPYAGKRADLFVGPLNEAMLEFEIDTIARQAAFLAQIAHESGSLKYVRELADGTAYEFRQNLGNTEPGDGPKFKGRGLIQITGRDNYKACGSALGVDLISNPELLEGVVLACRSAAWFWKTHSLNDLADKDDFKLITKKINGGYNGYQDRIAYYERAKEVLT